MFIGSSLQIDGDGNSSTVLRAARGFGGAPNLGHDPHGRRHPTPAWLSLIETDGEIARGRKLVVQMVETFQRGGVPTFVESLDAVELGERAGMPLAPVMIYGDDVSHVVTEEGVAYLYKAKNLDERRGRPLRRRRATPVGLRTTGPSLKSCAAKGSSPSLRTGRKPRRGHRSLLAARSIEDLVAWSGGLYAHPPGFRVW